MTAIVMIFEMTRDYDIVLPMIIAVAVAIGIRRVLSRENIYTAKLVTRRHFIPKALHANMFLVRQARDVMEKNVVVLPAETPFQEFLARTDLSRGLTHLVVTRGGKIASVQRINAGLRQGQGAAEFAVNLGAIAHRDFTVARADDIMYDVIGRMARRKASMAVIVRGHRRIPRADDVVGVVTKEHVADSVAETVKAYPQGA